MFSTGSITKLIKIGHSHHISAKETKYTHFIYIISITFTSNQYTNDRTDGVLSFDRDVSLSVPLLIYGNEKICSFLSGKKKKNKNKEKMERRKMCGKNVM